MIVLLLLLVNIAVVDFLVPEVIFLYVRSNKRRLQAQETKKRIFDVAQQMFREKGFSNVTVEEIADGAGMSVGTLYHHFKNKYEILTEWHKRLDEWYYEYYSKIKDTNEYKEKGVLELIREMMLYMNETCVNYGSDYISVVYSYMLSNPSGFGEIMCSRKRKYYKIMTELMLLGQKNGEITTDKTAAELTHDITIVSRGCLTDWVIEGAPDDMRTHTASVLDDFLKGISTCKKSLSK